VSDWCNICILRTKCIKVFFWGEEKSGKQCQRHFCFPHQEELRATPSLLCDVTEAPQGKTSIFRRLPTLVSSSLMISKLVNFLECTLLHLMANNDKVMKLGSPRFVFSSSKSCL